MPVKNPIGGTFETINEAIVKPVTDEVGKALEQGVQSVIGQTAQPQQPQAIQPNSLQATPAESAKMMEARRRLDFFRRTNEEVKKVTEDKKKRQAEAVKQVEESKQIKQFEIVKKQEKNIALEQATKKTEIRGGVGG